MRIRPFFHKNFVLFLAKVRYIGYANNPLGAIFLKDLQIKIFHEILAIQGQQVAWKVVKLFLLEQKGDCKNRTHRIILGINASFERSLLLNLEWLPLSIQVSFHTILANERHLSLQSQLYCSPFEFSVRW